MAVDDDQPTPGWLWPRNLGEDVSEELHNNLLLVPPGCLLPASWDIGLYGLVVYPLPDAGSAAMVNLIHDRWSQLPAALKSDPMFGPLSPCWPAILAAERGKEIEHGDADDDVRPRGPKNIKERWRFWRGRTIEEVLSECRARRDPARPRIMSYRGQLFRLPGPRLCPPPDPLRLLTLEEAHFLGKKGIPLPPDCMVPEDWEKSMADEDDH